MAGGQNANTKVTAASSAPTSPVQTTDTEKEADIVSTKEADPTFGQNNDAIGFGQTNKKPKKTNSGKKGGKKRKRAEAVEEPIQPIQPVEDSAAAKLRRSSRIGDGILKPSRFRSYS